MSMQGVDADGMEKFKALNAKTYVEQAQFFLNAMWAETSADAENVWKYTHKFMDLDPKKGDGCSLDEYQAHKFLESFGQTLTVIAMREVLRKIDLDSDGKMSLSEYLVFKYNVMVKTLLERPQGESQEMIDAAKSLKDVQGEIDKIEKEKTRLEIASQQDGVKGNTAKAELTKLLAQDQLPLNKAIISAEAALRKAQKAGGVECQGKLWWMQREIDEAKKYKPKAKQ